MCINSYNFDQTRFSLSFETLTFTCLFERFLFLLAKSGGQMTKRRVITQCFVKSLKYVEDLCLFQSGISCENRWKSSPFSCFRHFAPPRFHRWRSHRGLVSTRTCRVAIGLFTAVPASLSRAAFFYVLWAYAGTRKRLESSTYFTCFSSFVYSFDDFS